jgi:hypothetical protein
MNERTNSVIVLGTTVNKTGSYGVETLENYANVANVATITIPYGVTQVDYRLSTVDCGSNITIEPFNRPRIDTQIQQRLVPPTGFQGDVLGTVVVGSSLNVISNGVLLCSFFCVLNNPFSIHSMN